MTDVSIQKLAQAVYSTAPFSPPELFAELAVLPYCPNLDPANEVYRAVRQIFIDLELDRERIGTPEWNPLADLIKPGQRALLKPNLVYHAHPLGDEHMSSMITHASLLRPVIDYILLATGGDVQITIGDAPVQGGDFQRTAKLAGVLDLISFYDSIGIKIGLADFRCVISLPNRMEILDKRIANPTRDANSYTFVDLKSRSELVEVSHNSQRFEITDYGFGAVSRHHNSDKNEYMLPNEILEADLFINLPKLKTHRKAGLTCAMKNLVGINGDKTCLAHHTRGTKEQGGDEFSSKSLKLKTKVRIWTFLKTSLLGVKIASVIKWFFQTFVWGGKTQKQHHMTHKPSSFFEGSWHGNDTIWRCVKDLNKILLYADKNGNMQDLPQRNYLCLVDAVLAGEGEGPMEQTTKSFGVVLGGRNPVYIDYIAAGLMKFDFKNIPSILQGFNNKWWSLADKQPNEVHYISNLPIENISQHFVPTFGWQEVLLPFDFIDKESW